MTIIFPRPDPWYVLTDYSMRAFVLGMLALGNPVETLLVGAFYKEGRSAQRDMPLVMHQDGVRNEQLERDQGVPYVENPDVDFVGMYCLRGKPETVTYLRVLGEIQMHEIVLETGQGLVWDNRRVEHGRSGPVGNRVIQRMWIKKR